MPGTYTITIPEGSMSGDYCIDLDRLIVDDKILESTETFTVDLLGVSPCGTIGTLNATEVSILDDDCKIILISVFM